MKKIVSLLLLLSLFAQNANAVSYGANLGSGSGIPASEKGSPNGVATLDATGKVPLAQLPGGGGVTAVTGSAPISSTGGATPAISISQSGAALDGYLSSVDWNTFNNKQASGNYITDLTGDVTASGPGSVPATIANFAVTNAKIATATIDLTTKVTGVLPLLNGGSNSALIANAGSIIYSDADSMELSAAGAAGELLQSNGAASPSWVASSSLTGNLWSLDGNAGTVSGTHFIGTTDAQNLTIKTNNQNQVVYDVYGGWGSIFNHNPIDAQSKTQAYLQTNVVPTGNTGTANYTLNNNFLDFDGGTGFNYGGSVVLNNNQFTVANSGTLGYAALFDTNMLFGNNSGTTSVSKGINMASTISDGYTVSNHTNIYSNIAAGAGNFAGSGIAQSLDFNNTNITGLNLYNANAQIRGVATASYVNGLDIVIGLQDSADINGNLFGSNTSISMGNNTQVDNFSVDNQNIQINGSAEVVNNVYGSNFGLTVSNFATISGVTGLNQNIQILNNAFGGSITGLNPGFTIGNDATASSYTGLNINPDIGGNSIVGNMNLASITSNIHDTATVTNITGLIVNPTLQGNATATNFSGVNISPQVQGSALVANGLTALQISPASALGLPNARGIDVNMSGMTLSAAAIAAGEKKVGLAINDGSIDTNSNYTIPSAAAFAQNNYIGGQLTVAAGNPISGIIFGNNFSTTVNFQDNWGLDAFGLGYVSVSAASLIEGGVGATMDKWNGMAAGAQNLAGAGTLTDANMFTALGIINGGGALSVTNVYGFTTHPTIFGTVGTNVWAFYDDTIAENYLNRIAIGTTSKKVTAGTSLDVNGIMRLEDPSAGTNGVTISAPVGLAAPYALYLPPDDGSALQFLQTDGAGVTSWATPSVVALEWEREVPAGAVDNSNLTFTLSFAPSPADSLSLYQDGLILELGVDYTLAGSTITMIVAPNFGQRLYAVYTR